MSDTINQEVVFNADPESIYNVLLDADKFSQMTGASAEIGSDPGGSFSLFGGKIEGRHVELVPNQRIVQAWRVFDWEPGVYSIVKFELRPEGERTRLVFDQSGFPEEARVHLESGWHKMYWEPLKAQVG